MVDWKEKLKPYVIGLLTAFTVGGAAYMQFKPNKFDGKKYKEYVTNAHPVDVNRDGIIDAWCVHYDMNKDGVAETNAMFRTRFSPEKGFTVDEFATYVVKDTNGDGVFDKQMIDTDDNQTLDKVIRNEEKNNNQGQQLPRA